MMKRWHGKHNIWIKTIAMVMVCLFTVSDVAWAKNFSPSVIARRPKADEAISNLAAQSRLKPFFDRHGIDLRSGFAIAYAAVDLRKILIAREVRDSDIARLNNDPRHEVKIDTVIKKGNLSNRNKWACVTFYLNGNKQEVLLLKDYTNLSPEDLDELKNFKIRNDTDVNHLSYPGLEGVWFINPNAHSFTPRPPAAGKAPGGGTVTRMEVIPQEIKDLDLTEFYLGGLTRAERRNVRLLWPKGLGLMSTGIPRGDKGNLRPKVVRVQESREKHNKRRSEKILQVEEKRLWEKVYTGGIKTMLYPACGLDTITVSDMLNSIPTISDVYLVDNENQYSLYDIVYEFIICMNNNHYTSSGDDKVRLLVDEKSRNLPFVLTMTHRMTGRKIKLHFMIRDYTKPIARLKGKSDLTVVCYPGFGGELSYDEHRTAYYKNIFEHTRPGGYVYIVRATPPDIGLFWGKARVIASNCSKETIRSLRTDGLSTHYDGLGIYYLPKIDEGEYILFQRIAAPKKPKGSCADCLNSIISDEKLLDKALTEGFDIETDLKPLRLKLKNPDTPFSDTTINRREVDTLIALGILIRLPDGKIKFSDMMMRPNTTGPPDKQYTIDLIHQITEINYSIGEKGPTKDKPFHRGEIPPKLRPTIKGLVMDVVRRYQEGDNGATPAAPSPPAAPQPPAMTSKKNRVSQQEHDILKQLIELSEGIMSGTSTSTQREKDILKARQILQANSSLFTSLIRHLTEAVHIDDQQIEINVEPGYDNLACLFDLIKDRNELKKFLYVLSFIRILYPYTLLEQSADTPLEFVHNGKAPMLAYNKDIVVCPINEIFRRHILTLPRQGLAVQIKMPGKKMDRMEISSQDFLLSKEICRKFGQNSRVAKPIAMITTEGEFSLYGSKRTFKEGKFDNQYPLRLVIFEYEEGRRLTEPSPDPAYCGQVVNRLYLQRVAKTRGVSYEALCDDIALQIILACRQIFSVGCIETDGNMNGLHLENFSLSLDGKVKWVGDNHTFIRIGQAERNQMREKGAVHSLLWTWSYITGYEINFNARFEALYKQAVELEKSQTSPPGGTSIRQMAPQPPAFAINEKQPDASAVKPAGADKSGPAVVEASPAAGTGLGLRSEPSPDYIPTRIAPSIINASASAIKTTADAMWEQMKFEGKEIERKNLKGGGLLITYQFPHVSKQTSFPIAISEVILGFFDEAREREKGGAEKTFELTFIITPENQLLGVFQPPLNKILYFDSAQYPHRSLSRDDRERLNQVTVKYYENALKVINVMQSVQDVFPSLSLPNALQWGFAPTADVEIDARNPDAPQYRAKSWVADYSLDPMTPQNVHRFVIPVLPSVYPPTAANHYVLDRSYHEHLFRLVTPEDEVLILGSGSGLDVLIASLKSKFAACAIDVNPVAVLNTILLAKLAGFDVNALRNNGLILPDGRPVFNSKKFSFIAWNMMEYGRSEKTNDVPVHYAWDGDAESEVLNQFLINLPNIITPGGRVLIWNANDDLVMAMLRQGGKKKNPHWPFTIEKLNDPTGHVYLLTHHACSEMRENDKGATPAAPRPPASKGSAATLLQYMKDNRIFENNPKTSAQMAKRRGGNDSRRNIQRELNVLKRVGLLVSGDSKSGYYLRDWLRNTDIKELIKKNPALNIAKPNRNQILEMTCMVTQMSLQALAKDPRLPLRLNRARMLLNLDLPGAGRVSEYEVDFVRKDEENGIIFNITDASLSYEERQKAVRFLFELYDVGQWHLDKAAIKLKDWPDKKKIFEEYLNNLKRSLADAEKRLPGRKTLRGKAKKADHDRLLKYIKASIKKVDQKIAALSNESISVALFINEEANKIHQENLKHPPPEMSDKTILCHIITDSILSVEQGKTLKVMVEQAMKKRAAKGEEFRERVVFLTGANTNDPKQFLKDLRTEMRKRKDAYRALGYTDIRFDVACPGKELAGAILKRDPKIKILGFESYDWSVTTVVQVEGIVLALRALQSAIRSNDVEKLKAAYIFLSGNKLSPNQSAIKDISEFIKNVTFKLPKATAEDHERRQLNEIISKYILEAA